MTEIPNISYIKELSGEDEIFKKELISIIKSEFPLEKEIYFKNLKKEDYKNAAENVHKLKHKISILGLEKSYVFAIDYENNLREGDASLNNEFKAILQSMTDFLDKL